MSRRFAELFAGAGGLSLGLERAGWECAWHAELAEAPRAILQARWPDTPLYGDVTTLDGRALTRTHGPIDLLSGGSPCQDLSVAGKRAGLGGARSGLFFEQMRLWDETGADLCLWENVDGARSSSEGRDFGEVLRAFVGAAVVVPSDGWRNSGVAAGPDGVAAWRVLDAQYFGVPQRRRRVFVLGTRTGRVDPAQVLSLAESLRGDTPQSGEAGEGVAAATDDGLAFAFGSHSGTADGSVSNASHASGGPSGMGISRNRAHSLTSRTQGVVSLQEVGKRTGKSENFSQHGIGISHADDPMYTLQAGAQHGVIAFGQQNSARRGASAKCTPSLDRSKVPAVLAFNQKQDGSDADEVAPTLLGMPHDQSHANGGGQLAVCITGEQTHALTHEGSDGSEDGTGRGTPIVLAVDLAQITNKDNRSQPQPLAPTLNGHGDVIAFNETGHEKWTEERIAGSLNAHEAREAREAHTIVADQVIASTINGTQRQQVDGAAQVGIPRRLTPRECERLMGWPDDFTLVPFRGKPMSDSSRYKAIGNGVASVHSHWIGWRLRLALDGAA